MSEIKKEYMLKQKRKLAAKLSKKFYLKLLVTFLVAATICGCLLGFLWFKLDQYQRTTINGAIRSYISLVDSGDYHQIFEDSKIGYTQLNTEDVYTNYLKSIYDDKPTNKYIFTKTSTTATGYHYYDVGYEGERIATLEIHKTDDDKWAVRTMSLINYYYIDSFDGAKASFNGNLIEDNFITDIAASTSAYDNIIDKSELDIPTCKRYYVDNIIGFPEAAVTDQNNIIVKDVIKDQYYVAKKTTTEQEDKISAHIEETALTYAQYITRDASFNTLSKLLYQNSEFFESISSFNNQYFSDHDSIEFQNVKIYDIIDFDDFGFMGTISFDYVVTMGDISETYSSTYQLTFININNSIKCSNIVLAN